MRKTDASATDPTVYQWWVPLTYTHAGLDTSQKVSDKWMPNNENRTQVGNLGAKENEWVIFNYDQQSKFSYLFRVINVAINLMRQCI